MRRSLLSALALLPLLGACTAPELAQQPARVVFFPEDSAQLDPAAEAVVADAAALAARFPTARVRVEGFADPDGTRAYNRALSEARARSVVDALGARGVPPARVLVQPRGSVPFEAFPIESRRVEIHVGT